MNPDPLSASPYSEAPRVSIGMPVYNGERHVRIAIESLLAQTFADFELIISDNASTDGTYELCSEYVKKDPRVRLSHSVKNNGAAWNFNEVVRLARGEFFMWAAHDDEWDPTFVQRCHEALMNQPEAAGCYSLYQPIDECGRPHGTPLGDHAISASRRERWRSLLRNSRLHASIYGLMRLSALRKTRGLQACISSDLILISELLLRGPLLLVEFPLHRKRMPSDGSFRNSADVLASLGAKSRSAPFSRLKVVLEEIRGISHSALPRHETVSLAMDTVVSYAVTQQWLLDCKETTKEAVALLKSKRTTIGS